jgi:pyridoxal phosphate enzyme, YggS family
MVPRRQYSLLPEAGNNVSLSSLSSIQAQLAQLAAATGRPPARLLAVSKTQPASAIAALAAQGQRAFGENYVQEAVDKIGELAGLGLEWHLIGHLQSNKADLAARHFDWVQSVDRPKLVAALARHRPPALPPLNVLIQVNIDDEDSKHGCAPEQILPLAELIAAQPRLQLRGLMAIPRPHTDPTQSLPAFQAMAAHQHTLQARYPQVDTLSLGMSADFPQAVSAGATLVRVGSALFGARPAKPASA